MNVREAPITVTPMHIAQTTMEGFPADVTEISVEMGHTVHVSLPINP